MQQSSFIAAWFMKPPTCLEATLKQLFVLTSRITAIPCHTEMCWMFPDRNYLWHWWTWSKMIKIVENVGWSSRFPSVLLFPIKLDILFMILTSSRHTPPWKPHRIHLNNYGTLVIELTPNHIAKRRMIEESEWTRQKRPELGSGCRLRRWECRGLHTRVAVLFLY